MESGKPLLENIGKKLLSKEGAHNIETVSSWIDFILNAFQKKVQQSNFTFKCITRCSYRQCKRHVLKPEDEGGWVTQLVEHPTLDFGSGHDLTVHGIEPHIGLSAECGACLRFSVSGPLPHSCSFSKIQFKNF